VKLADYIINTLADNGIDKMFVVYGAANGDLIDAFTRTKKTEYVAVMHEQAGGFALEGYAKAKGKPGVAIATSGPGGQNFITPMGNCFYDSVPAIFLTGQVNSRFLRKDDSVRQIGFQETDIVSIARPVTKYAVMLRDPNEVRYELEKCLYLCTSGRPGPVLLDLPLDIQKCEIEPASLDGFDVSMEEPTYDLNLIGKQVDEFLNDFVNAQRPSLLIGGGVRNAGAVDELQLLSELLKVPLYPTWNALDVVTSDNPYYGGPIGTYGGSGRNFGIQNSDLLLAIGSRISGRITGGNIASFARGAKKYLVDIDKALLQRKNQEVPFDINIYADAKIFIQTLIDKTRKLGTVIDLHQSWTEKVITWKNTYDPVRSEYYDEKAYVHPYVFMRKLSEILPNNAVLVGDCGGNIIISNHAFKTKFGQRNLTNNGNSPMGFSFAGAIGACFGTSSPVICTIGDGGFCMNIQELQTLINYRIKLKTFILNNQIYGITKAYQETNFEGRAEACGPKGYHPPNFSKIAKAYGIYVVEIENNSQIERKVEEVLEYDGAVVCDVRMPEYHTYEPKIIGWETPIEDMYPYLSREEFIENMMIDPVEGWQTPFMPDVV